MDGMPGDQSEGYRLKTIPISAIQISPDRQRKEFDLAELNALGEDIMKRGLFHPLVLRQELQPTNAMMAVPETNWFLVSGERRLRAIQDIYQLGGVFRHDNQTVPSGEIPYVELGDLNELEREEAEYSENRNRANLTWQEDAEAVGRIASIRARSQGVPSTSAEITRELAREAAPSTASKEAGTLGIHQETARRQIIVAKHLADPEVKAAKSVDEAFKILRRKEDTEKRVQLAVEVGRTFSSSDHTALHEDSLAWMQAAAAEQFDVICTDPIYGIGADEFGDSGGAAAGPHFYKDDYATWKIHAACLAKEGFRITKTAAHLYAFCDITRFAEFKEILSEEGWNCFRTPIIWHKPNGNRTPWVDFGPQRKYEIILYANKGRKPVTRIYPDVVTYAADENLGHHAQKPVALYSDLLRRSCNPGDKALDPFSGSGPIFPAAQELKVKATGIEDNAAAYAIGIKRLELLKAAPELAGL